MAMHHHARFKARAIWRLWMKLDNAPPRDYLRTLRAGAIAAQPRVRLPCGPASIGLYIVYTFSRGRADRRPRKAFMNIFIFKSEANRELRAFSDDQGGHKLPAKFRPWHAVGVVKPDAKPPNNLSRDVIEKSIADAGYQLYKLKNEK
jgi:hypothetical protein